MSIGYKNQSAASVPVPPSGESNTFIDSADGKLKRKLPDNTVINVEAASATPTASGIVFTSSGDIVAANVQAAIEELDAEKAPIGHVGSGGTSHLIATGVVAGFLSPSDKTKIDSVSSGATANAADAFLLNRANHGGSQSSSTIAGFVSEVDARIAAQKAVSNGLATLDGSGKIPVSQLTLDATAYIGTWSAATNTPSLTNGVGDKGDFYKVSTDGSRDFGAGSITFREGEIVIYSGSLWERVGTNDAVGSVNGFVGAVILAKADIGLGSADDTSDSSKPVSTAQSAANAAVQAFSIQRGNHSGTQSAGTISDFTEAAQDAVLAAMADSATIDFTYDDAANALSAVVVPLSIANSHIAAAAAIALTKLGVLAAPIEQYRPIIAGDSLQTAINKLLYSSTLTYQAISADVTVPTGMEWIRGRTRLASVSKLIVQGTGRVRFI